MNLAELGKKAYQLCIEEGHEPTKYIDRLRSPELLQVAKQFHGIMKEKGLPGSEHPFNAEEIYLVIGAIGDAAREAGDNETASYVSQLLAEKKTEDKL